MKERIFKLSFTERKIPLNRVYHGDWTPDEIMDHDEDEEWAVKKYAPKKTKAPNIIVEETSKGYLIIDGRHRSRAAFLRGERSISAYVGAHAG